MAKKMLIDATHAEETRVVVVDGNKVEEFDFESENRRQLAGNIYLAKVTRVEPSLQAAFIDYGGNRHGFLAFSEIHPDYYQIPVADRQALMEEERAYAEALKAREDEDEKPKRRSRSRSRSKAQETASDDAVATQEVSGEDAGDKTDAASAKQIGGMETIDLDEDDNDDVEEGSSPMETVRETPVAESEDDDDSNDDDDSDDGDDAPGRGRRDAQSKDSEIESVADEDDHEDIRPPRKPRAKRYRIQEVIKVRQILLVQVVKEERGNKGAALTTYLSLAGRYCVLMPNTARGGGISRKITNAVDRKKLKEIATEIDVPSGAGLIVRTAGAKRTKSEIKRDYEYLQRLWEQIRELTLKSIAPAKIYEEGDLIKRSIRDLYSREIDEVLVEGERGYRNAKDFMKMIMPSHAKNVKHYAEQLPLFARFQVESYLSGMFNPVVQLKSGGYIVIGITEALVAIDVNSGRATKEGSIEETATKTNLEAAEEVARQLRLRDLAGLIVIDFIDMDERKNNLAVEKRIKDKLKTDRARIQVGRISGFGLMEMSRQRLRPGMLEATTQPCSVCHGTGLIRSDDNVALNILRQIEEEGTRRRTREVLVKAPIAIANYLMNQKREHVAQIESRYGMAVRIEGDPHLISPDFEMEKFKTATRKVVEAAHVVSANTSLMDDIDDEAQDDVHEEAVEEIETPETADAPAQEQQPEGERSDDQPKPKRRRRRRRKKKGGSGDDDMSSDSDNGSDNGSDSETRSDETENASGNDGKSSNRRSSGRGRRGGNRGQDTDTVAAETGTEAAVPVAEAAVPEKGTPETPAEAVAAAEVAAPAPAEVADLPPAEIPVDAPAEVVAAAEETHEAQEPVTQDPEPEEAVEATAAPETVTEADTATDEVSKAVAADPVAEEAPEAAQPEAQSDSAVTPEPSPEPVMAEETTEASAEADDKPKRRGWWSRG
ncbi:Rne/Rng family ribonuclease [Pseudooceanicola algae]|nr:ribonuclease E/G [Pseudooceanicola algae]